MDLSETISLQYLAAVYLAMHAAPPSCLSYDHWKKSPVAEIFSFKFRFTHAGAIVVILFNQYL